MNIIKKKQLSTNDILLKLRVLVKSTDNRDKVRFLKSIISCINQLDDKNAKSIIRDLIDGNNEEMQLLLMNNSSIREVQQENIILESLLSDKPVVEERVKENV
jgi:hypothetical protein